MVLPSGDPGLSWGIDTETGKELTGMVPHSEFCFGSDGTMTTAHFGVDEGLGDVGTYVWDGRMLKVHSDYPGDGWLFGSASNDSSCMASIEADVLRLTACSPANPWLDQVYTYAVGSASRMVAVELGNTCWREQAQASDGSTAFGDRLCFAGGNEITSTHDGITEGIESGGHYSLDYARLDVVSDGGEGWLWTPAVRGGSFSCSVRLIDDGDGLLLSSCTEGIPDTSFVADGAYE